MFNRFFLCVNFFICSLGTFISPNYTTNTCLSNRSFHQIAGFSEFFIYLDDILVAQCMSQTTFHRRVFYTFAPDCGIAEIFQQTPMNLFHGAGHCYSSSALCQNNWVFEIWLGTSSLGVNAYHTKRFPHFLQENVQTELHMYRNGSLKWSSSNLINFLDTNSIYFVINI